MIVQNRQALQMGVVDYFRGEADRFRVDVVDDAGQIVPLPERSDLINHSCGAFGWGYVGGGTSQLALAMLAAATGADDFATREHQALAKDMLAPLDKSAGWIIGVEEVQAWARAAGWKGAPGEGRPDYPRLGEA